jgi:hypothetical protein
VVSRLGWIKRQKSKFANQQRQTLREFVSGESHYFLGRRYRLNVIYEPGKGRVVCRTKTIIDLCALEGSTAAKRGRGLSRWYRAQLKAQIRPRVAKWEGIVGVQVAQCSVKQMKTKWGTCNSEARRIWLNLELIKKPPHCLEYVIVHEMVHFLVRHHNDRFTTLTDKFMPHWRRYRDELNRAPLSHETWDY